MTRKDYVLIAAALKNARGDCATGAEYEGVDTAARHVSDALAKDNPRFERGRFLTACGVTA